MPVRNAKLILLAIALFLPSLLHAQDASTLTGVVTDSSDAVVPGVAVTLRNPATDATYTATTNGTGSYTIANVIPGPGYEVTFALAGFETTNVSDLYMNVANTRTLNVKLQVGVFSLSVNVSAASQNVTLDTTDATIGNNFQVSLLNDLPVQDRTSPAALFTLQPGVTLDGSTTGARVDQNNVTLDGLDVNDIATGNRFAIVGNAPVDSVQEFRGTVAGNLAGSGPGGGGQFQLVTKSGTNEFHGNLNEYHRDTATTANDWFNNNAGVPRPPLIRNQFGGNIGGPILKDKFFFFFNYDNSRIVESQQVNRIVPLDSFRNGNISYINEGANCTGSSRQTTTPQCISTLSPAQVAGLDPQGVGIDAGLFSFVNQRYPHANDLSGGDGVNTGFYRFNTPTPDYLTSYVGRIDYNLGKNMKFFARFTVARENATQNPVQFPSDPVTSPFIDRSYAYVVGHTWTIGSNKVNQFFYGKTVSDYSFPFVYNPQGINVLTFADGTTTTLSDPYVSPVNGEARTYPIPVVGDDFSWQKGSHNFQFGGTFKFIKTYDDTKLDYNVATIGLGGNVLGLNAALRPTDILATSTDGATAANLFDRAFAFSLGRVGNVSSDYNYTSTGNPIAQGTGDVRRYRYYQTQVYFGDTWKVNSSLTLSYGLNYQYFSVPYETNGLESVEPYSFDVYFAERQQQSAAGAFGPGVVPFITYVLGGKANHGPPLYQPSWKDLAPKFAFAYSPSFDRKSVFNGGAGIVYDRTVINAVQFQQDQHSYLFQQTLNTPYGSQDPVMSLATDPRLGPNNSFPANAPPPPIKPPYTPFVADGQPFGLANGSAFNTIIDPRLKTPYSIALNFGFQHEFPQGFILKTNYVGRLGRRLLGQADANQLIDFPDQASGQLFSNAFGNITRQVRAGADYTTVTPQPWLENVVFPGIGQSMGFASNTALLTYSYGGLVSNGDFADFTQALSANELINDNVGMGSQFSENTFYTNKGFSSYSGLLTSLQKNVSHGLQFDLNYTWSHSIDNVSIIANQGASGGYGFICDARNLRVCRGNSDFDVANYISGDFTYSLPFGRGRTYGASSPFWLNEVIGGWDLSGLTSWHSGQAYSTVSNAFVAGYANDAQAIFDGVRPNIAEHHHKNADGSVTIFADPAKALGSFTGPVGFTIGSRNNLRGPKYFLQDLGLAKTFPVVSDKVNLKFRADAFNAFNHPNFDVPGGAGNAPDAQVDITSGVFGQIVNTTGPTGLTFGNARVMQFSLRLEF